MTMFRGQLELKSILLAAAALTLSGLLAGGGEALVGGFAGEVLGGVLLPGLGAVGAALMVAVEKGRHGRGQQVAVGAGGDGVHGGRAVVVGGHDGV